MSLIGRAKANAGYLKDAAATTRRASKQLERGDVGQWDVQLRLNMPDARSEAILSNLEAATKIKRDPNPRHDDTLRLKAVIVRTSMAGAAKMAVVDFTNMLRDAGVSDGELEEDMILEVSPAANPIDLPAPKGARQRIGSKIQQLGHGASVARADLLNIAAHHAVGSRTFEADLIVCGIPADREDRYRQLAEEILGGAQPLGDDQYGTRGQQMRITTENVANSLGAMLLVLGRTEPLLQLAGPTGRLVVACGWPEADDDGDEPVIVPIRRGVTQR